MVLASVNRSTCITSSIIEGHVKFLGSVRLSVDEKTSDATRTAHALEIQRALAVLDTSKTSLAHAGHALEVLRGSALTNEEKSAIAAAVNSIAMTGVASPVVAGSRDVMKQQEHFYLH